MTSPNSEGLYKHSLRRKECEPDWVTIVGSLLQIGHTVAEVAIICDFCESSVRILAQEVKEREQKNTSKNCNGQLIFEDLLQ